MRKIFIAHLITDLNVGGAENMLAKLVSNMDCRRFTQIVISLTDRGHLGDAIESAGVPVHCLSMRRRRLNLSSFLKLVRLLKTIKPTFIQSWLYHADFLIVLAAPFARSPPVLWNVRCSDMDLGKYSFQTQLILRALVLFSRIPLAILVNSQSGKEVHARMGYKARRWEVIPNGFDLERYCPSVKSGQKVRTELCLSDDQILIGMVARVDPMKDHETFFMAARQVIALRGNAYFLCIGKDSNGLEPMVAKHGLTGKVHLWGLRNDVHELYPGFDIFCLSSAFGEGLPNVLGEAMSCEVPCVSTDVGDARAVLGETGLVVPPRDPGSLAKAIIQLIDLGQEGRRTLGRSARERIRSEYALPNIIEKYEQFYETLL
jgi:glycosyltransferase involved in cell wall biosynthesis